MVEWVKMSTLLEPKLGNRFALVHYSVDDTMMLVNLNRQFIVMTDNQTERDMCSIAVEKARGDVLVIGFGLGMVLIPMMEKPEVDSITVLELEKEVLDIVASQLNLNAKVSVILADALDWRTERKFDLIWDDADYSPESSKNYFWDNSDLSKIGMAQKRFRSWLKDGGEYLVFGGDNG